MPLQGGDGDLGDAYAEGVRHAETPELAREALADCAVLIFKGQVRRAHARMRHVPCSTKRLASARHAGFSEVEGNMAAQR